MDLRHAAVVAMALHTGQRNHIQAEFMMRQGNRTFRLRPVRPVKARTATLLAAPDLQTQPLRPRQGDHRAAVLVAHAHRDAAGRTLRPDGPQHDFLVRSLAGEGSGHLRLLSFGRWPPSSRIPDSDVCRPSIYPPGSLDVALRFRSGPS